MRHPMKTITPGLLSTLLVGAAVFACNPGVAEAHRPWHNTEHVHAPQPAQDVSVTLESPGGGTVQTFWYGGSLYAAGHNGARYNLRLQNNTGERVEAVVTVDGRDVVSGQLGNYKSQRGYVMDPHGSVVIEGFRQSLDQVAAFRFTDIGNSYSARRGSGQHVGVIGVAVFKEYQPRRRPSPPPPVPIATRPYYEPGAGDAGGYDYRRESRAPAAKSAEAAAPTSAPPHGGGAYDRDDAVYEEAEARPRSNRLGTEYGESTYSSVREVSFTRKHKRRPDALLTIYYDSLEGLRARGVPVDPPVYHHPPPLYPPQPFPNDGERHNQYAPPPPPRRY